MEQFSQSIIAHSQLQFSIAICDGEIIPLKPFKEGPAGIYGPVRNLNVQNEVN